MPAFRNMLYWFNGASRSNYKGPTVAALVLDDGSLVHIDFSNGWADRTRAQTFFDRYVGHVTLVPKPNKWGFEAKSPVNPMHTLRGSCDYDSAEEAALAMIAYVAEFKAKNDAIVADPEKHLEQELGRFDWFAHYSDNPGTCLASDHHWKNTILPLKARVGAEVWRALFTKHAPAECSAMGAA